MFKILLLALVPAVLARIEVNIKVGKNVEQSRVELLGSSVELISDTERNTFKLSGSQVTEAAYRYHGGHPSGVYFRSPTPWGDMYSQYGWTPVSRTLVPKSAKIITIHTEPSVVARREFINNSTLKATYNAGISEEVEQTTSNSWSTSGDLTVGQEIEYGIDLGAAEIGGKTSISFSSGWGRDRSKSESIKIGTTSGVEVELLPGQAVVSELSAKRGTMEVEVVYEASLDGNVFCNYDEPHKGHYFWRYDVNALLSTMNLPRTVTSKEIIKIGFYSDATIIVRDVLSTNKIVTHSLPNSHIKRLLHLVPGASEESHNIVPVDIDPKAKVSS